MEKTVNCVGNIYLDLSHYTGKDCYSDGDIEEELLFAAQKGKLQELLETDNRWPVLYHVSKNRENLLDWLPANKNARVLEIGSGCGAVTGILADKFKKVDTVEISERRAKISAYRHSERDNVTIHVGNLNDMEFENKFDVITLIGVLEYAPTFTHSSRPFEDFLTQIRSFLAEGGVLIIAIENRLGMKYWTGAEEDHLNRRFIGLTGYSGVNNVKTFSKKELSDLMKSVGFNALKWYYPFPDYKIPTSVYSDIMLPTANEILTAKNRTYDKDRLEIFSENEALSSMVSAGLYDEFSNSFLVFASEKDISKLDCMPSAVYHSTDRKSDYSLVTEFYTDSKGNKRVVKTARTVEQRRHLNAIYENYHILSEMLGKEHVAKAELITGNELEIEYIEGETLMDKLKKEFEAQNLKEFASLIFWYKKNVIMGGNDETLLPKDISPYKSNRNSDIDVNFGNVVLTESGFKVYDYEWLFPNVSKDFILFRSLLNFLIMNKIQLSAVDFFDALGFSREKIKIYNAEEQRFQNCVIEHNLNYARKRKPMS